MSDTDFEIDLADLIDTKMLRAAERQYKNLGATIARLTRKQERVGIFITLAKEIISEGESGQSDLEDAPKAPRLKRAPRSSATWKATILQVLEREVRGLTHDEVKAELAKTDLADRLAASDKGYYGAVGRLVEDKTAVRHRGRLYSKAAFTKFQDDVAAGLVADVEAPKASQSSPIKEAILVYLADKPHGERPKATLAHIRKLPEYRSDTAVYNLMSRMRKRGELVKRGKRDVLPPRNDAAPSEHKSNGAASVTGGGATPPIESRQVGDLLG